MWLAPPDFRAFEPPTAVRNVAVPLVHELLHAMGQPLTTLQSCRLFGRMPNAEPGITNHLLEDMADQVDQVTEIYRALRTLLEADAAADESTNIGQTVEESLLQSLIPDWRRRASRRNIALTLKNAFEQPTRKAADYHPQAAQALDILFSTVLATVPGGSQVHVALSVAPEGAHVVFTGGGLVTLEWKLGWMLRVAEALLGSSGGDVKYTSHPFSAAVVFAQEKYPSPVPPHE